MGCLSAIISLYYQARNKTGHYHIVTMDHQGLTFPTGKIRAVIIKSLQKYSNLDHYKRFKHQIDCQDNQLNQPTIKCRVTTKNVRCQFDQDNRLIIFQSKPEKCQG